MDNNQAYEVERVQALRFIRKVIYLIKSGIKTQASWYELVI